MPWKLLGVGNAPLSAALGALAPEQRLRLSRLVDEVGGEARLRPFPVALERCLLEAAQADNVALYLATEDALELVASPTFLEADRIVWGTVPTDALVGVAAAHRRNQPIYLVHQQSEDLDDEAFARIPAFDAFAAVAYLPFGGRQRRPAPSVLAVEPRSTDDDGADIRRSFPPIASGARRTTNARRGVLLLGFHQADALLPSARPFYETLAALCAALVRSEPGDEHPEEARASARRDSRTSSATLHADARSGADYGTAPREPRRIGGSRRGGGPSLQQSPFQRSHSRRIIARNLAPIGTRRSESNVRRRDAHSNSSAGIEQF